MCDFLVESAIIWLNPYFFEKAAFKDSIEIYGIKMLFNHVISDLLAK